MNRILLLVFVLLALSFLILVTTQNNALQISRSSSPSTNCANPCTIGISNNRFDGGREVIITRETAVTWRNYDPVAHTATSSSHIRDTGVLPPGSESPPVVFLVDGSFLYHCSISLSQGVIVVIG